MLFALVFLLIEPAAAQDMSWVKKLDQEIKEYTKMHKEEIQSFVEKSEQAAAKYRTCPSVGKIVNRSVPHNGTPEEQRIPDLLVFVSFSMPMETLKALNEQAERHGGKLVFRGLVDGSFKKMSQRLQELGAEVLIDPTLFQEHAIEQVPVFVKGSDKLSGNVSLDYALSKFKGETS